MHFSCLVAFFARDHECFAILYLSATYDLIITYVYEIGFHFGDIGGLRLHFWNFRHADLESLTSSFILIMCS